MKGKNVSERERGRKYLMYASPINSCTKDSEAEYRSIHVLVHPPEIKRCLFCHHPKSRRRLCKRRTGLTISSAMPSVHSIFFNCLTISELHTSIVCVISDGYPCVYCTGSTAAGVSMVARADGRV